MYARKEEFEILKIDFSSSRLIFFISFYITVLCGFIRPLVVGLSQRKVVFYPHFRS